MSTGSRATTARNSPGFAAAAISVLVPPTLCPTPSTPERPRAFSSRARSSPSSFHVVSAFGSCSGVSGRVRSDTTW